MAQKVCPRCGAFYATLKSATCPQCFAKLIEVDDETAAEIAAERARLESTPEFQEAKAEEDEQYRHKSFQACLGAVGMTVALIILFFVLVVVKIHHTSTSRSRSTAAHAAPSISTAAARPEDVMPARVGSFHREKLDQPASLSGTLTLIYHAAYAPGSGAESTIDVYAAPVDRPAADLSRFRDVVDLASMAGDGKRSVTEVSARPFLYEIVGASGADAENEEFRAAWRAQVGGK